MTKKIRKIWEDITGVSPIIAVILMVAITVVLAATIYVWVSGFGSQSSAKSASFTAQDAYDRLLCTDADEGMDWQYVKATWEVNSGGNISQLTATLYSDGSSQSTFTNGQAYGSSDTMDAGDYILFEDSGSTIEWVRVTLTYTETNNVLGTWTVYL